MDTETRYLYEIKEFREKRFKELGLYSILELMQEEKELLAFKLEQGIS